MVLDIGAGSGLLGMLAARAGADKVVGVEQSLHMCEVGEECEVMNGFLPKCMMLHRDSRRVMAPDSDGAKNGRKPDGNLCELERKADILIYEVFDSGYLSTLTPAFLLTRAIRCELLSWTKRCGSAPWAIRAETACPLV
jgi:hypothetical protein